MAINGIPTGPIYSLGLITVTTAGTPVELSQNVSTTTGFGTAASPSPLVFYKIIVTNNSASGTLFLIHKGSGAATANSGVGVILAVAPGATGWFDAPQTSNPFDITKMQADSDVSGTAAYVTLFIL